MVEVEERHSPGGIQAVSKWFSDLGYRGFFLLEDAILPMSRFRPELHQNSENLTSDSKRIGTYVNNFIYLPAGRTELS